LKTIAVIALKGGSGKTTVATHLALAAHRRGRAVLLADVDPQCSARDILAARSESGPEVIATTGPKLMAAQFAAVGLKKELMVVDTAAGSVEDAGEALVLSDLAVLVVRPTLLDLAGLVRTLSLVRRLQKPHVVVVNQAQIAREGVEPPVVKRALKGLDYMQVPLAPVILRSRTIYQTALETGRSVEEATDASAAREVAALWEHVDGMLAAGTEAAAQRA
jgi:chromosome partitioning protein